MVPFVDPQGTLHDPDYRPFPLIKYSKQSTPSPFAVRKPYWESEADDFETGFGDAYGDDDGYDTDESQSDTPTSTSSFICYFLETHPLGAPLRAGSSSSHILAENKKSGSCFGMGKKNKRNQGRGGVGVGGGRAQYVCAKFSAAAGVLSRNPSYVRSPSAPTATSLPPVPQYADAILASPEPMDEVSITKGKRGWGGRLWKKGGEKD